MVARNHQSARLKVAVAAGGLTLVIFLAVVGGVVGWFSVSSPDQLHQPEVMINLDSSQYQSNLSEHHAREAGVDWAWRRGKRPG